MTLGEVIKEYREKQHISQREFAKMSGLSNGYISMLEKNQNKKTGKPMIPNLDTYKQIATAMNMTVHELFELADDAEVDISVPTEKELDRQINEMVKLLSPASKQSLLDFLRTLVHSSEAG